VRPWADRTADRGRILYSQTRQEMAGAGAAAEPTSSDEDGDDLAQRFALAQAVEGGVGPLLGAAALGGAAMAPGLMPGPVASAPSRDTAHSNDSLAAAAVGGVLPPGTTHAGLPAGVAGLSGSSAGAAGAGAVGAEASTRIVTSTAVSAAGRHASSYAPRPSLDLTGMHGSGREGLPGAAPRSPRRPIAVAEGYKAMRAALPALVPAIIDSTHRCAEAGGLCRWGRRGGEAAA
jgi:hypothetical protein